MANDPLTGQDVIDMINGRLAGYQNAVDSAVLLDFANEAKDQIWLIIKALQDEYFQVISQASDSNAAHYFAPLNVSSRAYNLPSDFREIRFVEVVTPGFTDLKFEYRSPTSSDFRIARQAANENASPIPNQNLYLYAITGKNQFILADYPPGTVTLNLWYTRSLPDFEAADPIDEILFPYSKAIATYAVKGILLSTQDVQQWNAWKSDWRDTVIQIAEGASDRNEADPIFVEGFMEGDDAC